MDKATSILAAFGGLLMLLFLWQQTQISALQEQVETLSAKPRVSAAADAAADEPGPRRKAQRNKERRKRNEDKRRGVTTENLEAEFATVADEIGLEGEKRDSTLAALQAHTERVQELRAQVRDGSSNAQDASKEARASRDELRETLNASLGEAAADDVVDALLPGGASGRRGGRGGRGKGGKGPGAAEAEEASE